MGTAPGWLGGNADAGWACPRRGRLVGLSVLVALLSVTATAQATSLIASPKDAFRMYLPGHPSFGDGGVVASPDGSLVYVVVHPENEVYVFNGSNGKLKTTWHSRWLSGPRGVGTDGFGNVYVASQTSGVVAKFSPTGKVIAHWSVKEPISIAVAPRGPVYVLRGYANNRIVEFGLGGRKVGGFNANLPGHWFDAGGYSHTAQTFAMALGLGPGDDPLVVGESKQSLDGNPCASSYTPTYNWGLCSEPFPPPDNPLVSGEVVRFSPAGVPLNHGWLNETGGLYGFGYSDGTPTGVAVDPNGGSVYVSDLEDRIDYLQHNLVNPDAYSYPNAWPSYALRLICWVCSNKGYNATSPAAIAFDCRSNLYVLNPGTDGVDVYVNQDYPVNPPCSPIEVSKPSITGTTQQGDTLRAHHGSVLKATYYSYQWERCNSRGGNCGGLGGPSGASYKLTTSDVGHTIRVQVLAGNAGNSSVIATSAPTSAVLPPPPASLSPPTISGSMVQGQTLTVALGRWSGDPTAYNYAWEDCDASGRDCALGFGGSVYSERPLAVPPGIGGPVVLPNDGLSASYMLTGADVGHTMRVEVWATNPYGGAGPVISGATAVVLPLPPADTSLPSIAGDLTEGRTLNAIHGSWSHKPTGFSYQWENCVPGSQTCTPIAGANGPQYLLSASNVGSGIALLETASNAGGRGVVVGSPVSAAVAAAGTGGAPVNSITPVIRGQAAYGDTLTSSVGAWEGRPSLTYSFQWQDCKGAACTNIAGATSNTYAVTGSISAGDTIDVTVTATNTDGSGSATSAAVGPIAAPPTPPPIIHPPPGGPPPV